MKTPILLGALLCATICAVAQETTTTLDLSKVKLEEFPAEGKTQQLTIDGVAIDGVYYDVATEYTNGTPAYPIVKRHLRIEKSLTLTGTATDFGLIVGADDLTITLDGVSLQTAGYYISGVGGARMETFCTGQHAVTLKLAEGSENLLKGSGSNASGGVWSAQAGVTVPSGGTLTIEGPGKLTAIGGEIREYGVAGIGADFFGDNRGLGKIVIKSGTIVATGTNYGAGIGTTYFSPNAGEIIINGGTVTATGGAYSAGIGGGGWTKTPTITIADSMVTATGGAYSAGIGSGYEATATSTITINSGTVVATGGDRAAAIGGGYASDGGTITINGGNITAKTDFSNRYAIGAGYGMTACTFSLAEAATIDAYVGITPDGTIYGALKVDVSQIAAGALPEHVSYDEDTKTLTIASSNARAVLLTGSNADLTVVLPNETLVVSSPLNGSAGATMKAIKCDGAFKILGNTPLTLQDLTGNVTLTQRAGAPGTTLKVSNTCSGKVDLVGKNAVILPALENLGTYMAGSLVETLKEEEGKLPLSYSSKEEIPSPFDVTTLTANAKFPADSGWSVAEGSNDEAVLTVPTGAGLTGSTVGLAVEAAGDLTLKNLSLDAKGLCSPVTMVGGGTVTLQEENTLKGAQTFAALRVPAGKSVTIVGDGSLRAESESGAGIGGTYDAADSTHATTCGNVTLSGTGTVVAISSSGAAIGGAYDNNTGTLTVTSGKVVAVSVTGAGIGLGHAARGGKNVSTIAIIGGQVLAYASSGAAIGTGTESGLTGQDTTTTIKISGGTIVATANVKPTLETVTTKMGVDETTAQAWLDLMTITSIASGAGIGGGSNGCFGTIEITGGDITAASLAGAGIGGGHYYASSSNPVANAAADSITIKGTETTIVATSERAAAIGAGTTNGNTSSAAIGSIVIEEEATVAATTSGSTASAIGGSGLTGVSKIVIANKDKVTAASFGSGSDARVNADVSISYPSTSEKNPISTSDAGVSTVHIDLAKEVSGLVANGSATLKDASGGEVARVEQAPAATGSGQTTTLVVLDPALNLEASKTAALLTKQETKTDAESVMEKVWLLNAGLVFAESSESETPAYDLTYTYEFGIQDFSIGSVTADGIELTRVVVGLTEGDTPRSATLNGKLRVKSGSTVLFEVESPVFTEGKCALTPTGDAPKVKPAAGESTIVLTVHLSKD